MKKLIAKFLKFKALNWSGRRLFFMAIMLLPVFWLGLRLLGLQRFQILLNKTSISTSAAPARLDIHGIAMLVNIAASQLWFSGPCLIRSLLLWWLLNRRGVISQLRIGVRLEQGALAAHAWVEYDGKPINDRPEVVAQYAAFADIVPDSAFKSA